MIRLDCRLKSCHPSVVSTSMIYPNAVLTMRWYSRAEWFHSQNWWFHIFLCYRQWGEWGSSRWDGLPTEDISDIEPVCVCAHLHRLFPINCLSWNHSTFLFGRFLGGEKECHSSWLWCLSRVPRFWKGSLWPMSSLISSNHHGGESCRIGSGRLLYHHYRGWHIYLSWRWRNRACRSFPSNDANIFIGCGENMITVWPA